MLSCVVGTVILIRASFLGLSFSIDKKSFLRIMYVMLMMSLILRFTTECSLLGTLLQTQLSPSFLHNRR